jgi:hypothetical protein
MLTDDSKSECNRKLQQIFLQWLYVWNISNIYKNIFHIYKY